MKWFIPVFIAVISSLGYAETVPPESREELSLTEACVMALENNPNIKSVNAELSRSTASANKAEGMLQPNVTLKSSYGYLSEATLFGITPIMKENTLINTLEISQILYSGGALQQNASAAKWAKQSALSMNSAVRNQIIANTAIAYYKVKQAEEYINVADASVAHLDANYQNALKLHKAGVVTQSDALRAEVALTMAKEQAITARNNYNIALANLKNVIGISQTVNISLSKTEAQPDWIIIDTNKQPQRDEVESAKYALQSAQSQWKAAKSANQPNVYLVADYENQPEGAEFPRKSNTLRIGLMASINLFDGGRTKASVAEAQSSVNKAQANLQNVTQSVELQLEVAKYALSSAKARVETSQKQVESAQESFRTIETGYTEGINVLTDVLSVEAMLTASRVAKLSAEYDLKIAEINLLLAQGSADALLKNGGAK